MVDDNEEREGPLRIFVVLLATLAAVGISLWRLLANPDALPQLTYQSPIETWVYLGGQSTVITLAVFVVLYLVYLRGRTDDRSLVYFLIMLAAVFVADVSVIGYFQFRVVANSIDIVRVNAQNRYLEDQTSRVMAYIRDPGDAPIGTTGAATGEMAEVDRLLLELAKSAQVDAMEFRMQIKALDYPAFALPARLAADRGLVHTRAKLKTARALLKTYRAQIALLVGNFPLKIAHAELSADLRDRFGVIYETQLTQQSPLRERFLDCADGVYAELDAMAADLAHAHGRWTVDGTIVRFSDPRDLEAYRRHGDAIRDFEAEERAIVAQTQAGMAAPPP